MMAASGGDPARRERQSSIRGPTSAWPGLYKMAICLLIPLMLAGQSFCQLPPQSLTELAQRETAPDTVSDNQFDPVFFRKNEAKYKDKPICPPNVYWRVEWRYDSATHNWRWDYPVTQTGPGYRAIRNRRFHFPNHKYFGKGKLLAGDPQAARPLPAAGSTVWFYQPNPNFRVPNSRDTGMPPLEDGSKPFSTPSTAGYPYFTQLSRRISKALSFTYAVGETSYPGMPGEFQIEYWDPAEDDPKSGETFFTPQLIKRKKGFRHEWHEQFSCLEGTQDRVDTATADTIEVTPSIPKTAFIPNTEPIPQSPVRQEAPSERLRSLAASLFGPPPAQHQPLTPPPSAFKPPKRKPAAAAAASSARPTDERSVDDLVRAITGPPPPVPPKPKTKTKTGGSSSKGAPKNVVPPKVNQPKNVVTPKEDPHVAPPKEDQQKVASGAPAPDSGPGDDDDKDKNNRTPDGPPGRSRSRSGSRAGRSGSGPRLGGSGSGGSGPERSRSLSPKSLTKDKSHASPDPGHAADSSVRRALFRDDTPPPVPKAKAKTDLELNPWKKRTLDTDKSIELGWWFKKFAVKIHVPDEVNNPANEKSFGEKTPPWLSDYSYLVHCQMWILLHAPKNVHNDYVPDIDDDLTHNGLLQPQRIVRERFILMKFKNGDVEDLDPDQGRHLLLRPTPPLLPPVKKTDDFDSLRVPADHLMPAPYIPYDWYSHYHITDERHPPYYYEHLTLVWSWIPTYRMTINMKREEKKARWMIHGLWPQLYTPKVLNNGKRDGPVFCETYQPIEVDHLMIHMRGWYESLSIQERLKVKFLWTSTYLDETKDSEMAVDGLWLNQWRKHGTCAHWSSPHFVSPPPIGAEEGEVVDPHTRMALQTEMMLRYFKVTLRLAEKYSLGEELSTYCKPSILKEDPSHQAVLLETIRDNVEKKLAEQSKQERRKGSVLLSCHQVGDKLMLQEVRICLHPVSLKPVHCGRMRGDSSCYDRSKPGGIATHVYWPIL